MLEELRTLIVSFDPEKGSILSRSLAQYIKKEENIRSALQAVQSLDTTELTNVQDKLVARLATLLSGFKPLSAAEVIVGLLMQGELGNIEATRIFKHVWWSHFLKDCFIKNTQAINDFARIFPNQNDREIQIAIFRACYATHFELSSLNYEKVKIGIEHFKSVPKPNETNFYPPSEDLLTTPLNYRLPNNNEVYVHDMRTIRRSETVLANMIASGANLLSASLIGSTERGTFDYHDFRDMGAIGHAINTVVATPDNYEPYSDNSAVSFLIPGSNLLMQGDYVIEAIHGSDANNIAGILNQFDINDIPIAGDIPIDLYYISLDFSRVNYLLLPLIRLMAGHATEGGSEYFNHKVIIHTSLEERIEIVKQLALGDFNVEKWNENRLREYFDRKITKFISDNVLSFDGRMVSIDELKNMTSHGRVVYGFLNLNGVSELIEQVEYLEIYYPTIMRAMKQKLKIVEAHFQQRVSIILSELKHHTEGIYDHLRKLFYIVIGDTLYIYPTDTEPIKLDKSTIFQTWEITQGKNRFTISDSEI